MSNHQVGSAGALHSRTYSWHPLQKDAKPLAEMDGLSFLKHQLAELDAAPPIAKTLGWQIVHAEAGLVRVELPVQEYLMHGAGIVHGGVLSTLADSAMASAVMSQLERGAGCTTLQLNVNFLRSVSGVDNVMQAEGRVVHLGRRTATTEAVICDKSGKSCLTATSTYLIFPLGVG